VKALWRSPWAVLVVAAIVAGLVWRAVPEAGSGEGTSPWLLAGLAVALVVAAISVQRLAAQDGHSAFGLLTAALFGLWVLFFWQVGVTVFDVPRVLLPAPSAIVDSMVAGRATLARDFVQTVLKAVVAGWALGSALVAIAPIMVMWFGFEWPSKAAVVVLMTFFPMLISTLAGLQAAGRQERELMHSYAAGYVRTLVDLRLPCAVPFIVSALKINATLALIGAIVAEFFGSPTVGLGFRISTEAARMNMSLVWGAIVVAAITGSAAYALLVRLERRLAFWHPSVRSK